MKQWPFVAVGKKVALNLQADVAPIAGGLARSVAKSRQLQYALPERHKALVDGVHRIFEGERPLKLPQLYAEGLILLPFGKHIHHTRRRAEGGRIAVKLHLGFPIEVGKRTSFQRKARHADVKAVALRPFLVGPLILRYHVPAKFEVAHQGKLLFFWRYIAALCAGL